MLIKTSNLMALMTVLRATLDRRTDLGRLLIEQTIYARRKITISMVAATIIMRKI